MQILENDRPRGGAEPSLEVSRHPDGELASSRIGGQLRLRSVRVSQRERGQLPRDRSRFGLVEAFHAGDARLDLGARRITSIGRRDRGLPADQLLQRPVRDRVSVWKAGRARDRLGRVQATEELERDPCLTHARVAIDRDEMWSTSGRDTPVHVVEQPHLRFAPDERTRRVPGGCARSPEALRRGDLDRPHAFRL